jgi:hypothetical protein
VGVAVVAPEEAALTATGWLPVPGTEGRYWTHPARYGEAYFDRHEVAQIENGNGQQRTKPRRAPACRCSLSYGRLEESICWKCGRRVSL